ncbi:hypothetical protein M3Y98_00101800 [Aphelenchoides besseyi]|nr:hypothetical protein M3Y98_00101800 [Aphelenchoides besseyi]KAI6194446.1 hypothetical protein M3Y96_01125700 [Aphelenchoides besseyi]
MEKNVSVTPAEVFTQLRNIEIWESDEFRKRLMRSGGPGGQNVNNVSTKVEIRFDVHKANWLPSDVRDCLIRKERNRINKLGELVISSDKTRHAESNEADCYGKLQSMIVECVRQIKMTNLEPTDEDKRILAQRALIAEQRRRQLKEQLKKKRENRLNISFCWLYDFTLFTIVVFGCTETPKTELQIQNSWDRSIIFKLKSTRPNILKMRPVFGTIGPNDKKAVTLTICSEKPDAINWNSSDRFVVVIAPLPVNCTNVSQTWKSHCSEVAHQSIRKVLKIRLDPRVEQQKSEIRDAAKNLEPVVKLSAENNDQQKESSSSDSTSKSESKATKQEIK